MSQNRHCCDRTRPLRQNLGRGWKHRGGPCGLRAAPPRHTPIHLRADDRLDHHSVPQQRLQRAPRRQLRQIRGTVGALRGHGDVREKGRRCVCVCRDEIFVAAFVRMPRSQKLWAAMVAIAHDATASAEFEVLAAADCGGSTSRRECASNKTCRQRAASTRIVRKQGEGCICDRRRSTNCRIPAARNSVRTSVDAKACCYPEG